MATSDVNIYRLLDLFIGTRGNGFATPISSMRIGRERVDRGVSGQIKTNGF